MRTGVNRQNQGKMSSNINMDSFSLMICAYGDNCKSDSKQRVFLLHDKYCQTMFFSVTLSQGCHAKPQYKSSLPGLQYA
jgi:hypothetical protein